MNKKSSIKDDKLRKYLIWSRKYPDHLVLMQSGYFYVAWGRSAEVINEILNYKLAYSKGSALPFTGGPNLEKILKALSTNCISYLVVVNDEIVEKEVFESSSEIFYEPDIHDFKVGTRLQQQGDPPISVIITKIEEDTVQLMHKELIMSPPHPDFFEGKIHYIDKTEFVIIIDLNSDCFTTLHYKSFDKSVLSNLHPLGSDSKKEESHPNNDSSYNYLDHYRKARGKPKSQHKSSVRSQVNSNKPSYNKMDGSPYSEATYSPSRSVYDKKRNRKRFEGTGK